MKAWGHLKVITKHKWIVFGLCVRAGIPWRGLVHDLSKYSPTEFLESATHFTKGTESPINLTKKLHGYSKAWLHHKGRNKHHPEYWYDETAKIKAPVIPYPYAVEMICDKIAAGMVYVGKQNWTPEEPLDYYTSSSDPMMVHPLIHEFIIAVLTALKENGIKRVITSRFLKGTYEEICQKETIATKQPILSQKEES